VAHPTVTVRRQLGRSSLARLRRTGLVSAVQLIVRHRRVLVERKLLGYR
jgi:hypothetical protein